MGYTRMPHCALVIEDDAATSYIFQQVLSSLGLSVSSAGDGATALECLHHQTYDLIFLDLLLPRVSGMELLRQCHQLEHLQNAAIVIVTAHARMRGELALRPNDQFLLKPVLLRDLYTVVSHALPDVVPVTP